MTAVEPIEIINTIMWDGTKYIMFDNTIKTSLNGVDWDTRFANERIRIIDMAWSGNRFVATATNNNVIVSNDGINWSLINTGLYFHEITWNGQCFTALGLDGIVAVSTDGIEWTTKITNFNETIRSLSSNKYGFISNIGTITGDKNFFFSKDGYNWNLIKKYSKWSVNDTAANDKCFVALASIDYSCYILYSANGIDWIEIPIKLDCFDITCNGQMFVASGSDGKVLVSEDGKNWSQLKINQDKWL